MRKLRAHPPLVDKKKKRKKEEEEGKKHKETPLIRSLLQTRPLTGRKGSKKETAATVCVCRHRVGD